MPNSNHRSKPPTPLQLANSSTSELERWTASKLAHAPNAPGPPPLKTTHQPLILSLSSSSSPEPQFLPTRNNPAFTTSKFPTRQESCTTGGIFLKIKIKKSKTQNKTHLPQQQKKKKKII
jgi:hypothetical protein